MTLSDSAASIDAQRRQGDLSSALRLFVLDRYRGRACDMEARYGIMKCSLIPRVGTA